MPIRPIVKYGEPVLHGAARPVAEIDAGIHGLFRDMVSTMYAAPGIGLAAPQVGVPLRAIVIDLSVGEDEKQLIRLVNPEIVEREGEQQHEDGCLSIDGKEKVFEATELLARAFCHEIDHIDGLLFVDRLSPLKRDLMKRKLRKKAREGWEE